MKINREQLAAEFGNLIENDRSYQRAQRVVLDNASEGKIWIIGGYLYRNLIKLANGTNGHRAPNDYDFLVEKPNPEIKLPFGWSSKKNIFGNPKFLWFFGLTKVDFVPLDEVHSTIGENNPPSISGYLRGVPLSVHSVAYDLRAGTLEGDKGLESIEKKIVYVNNPKKFMDAVARRKGMTLEKYIRRCASSLRFDYRLGCSG